MKRYLFLLFSLIAIPMLGFAQGKTSSAIEGTVTDAQGEPLPGANVVAIHQPSGTRYGTATLENGRYTLKNVQAGGPYIVQVTFVGYNPQKKQIGDIKLGDRVALNFHMEEGSMSLAEISVTAQANTVFNTERTGAKTNISREEIDRTPTLSRSLGDYTRLTPQATGGGSFGGANNRYNNLLVDGATLNDVFGLGEGTPGSQAGVQSPISIDAIQEFNVDLAPYDVTNNNFNGAQINAITRSGTNTYTGSVYFQLRNQSFAGNYVKDDGSTSNDVQDFDEKYYGIRLGGPIIKNKLFFFVNGELKRRSAPLNAGIQESGQGNIFPAGQGLFNDISNIFKNKYGYNPGSVSPLSQSTDNNKVLAKLNWNIDEHNKFMFRYNYVFANEESGINRSPFSYDFSNRQYNFRSIQNSFVAELNSNFSKNISNEFRAVYTRIRDSRNVVDQPFPQVEINLSIDDRDRSINSGIDRFSQANSLGQDLFELTDNFTYVKGAHELTLGTSNQFFHFNNLFVQDAFGTYVFQADGKENPRGRTALENFKAANPYQYQYSYLLPGGNPRAEFDGIQLGFYAQDKWKASDRLTVTGGLRVDIPILPDSPTYNQKANQAFGYRSDNVASGNILWSPRLGFNYDASSDGIMTQIRGGIGIFSGPPPFVWISNQYSNTGVDYGRVDINDGFYRSDNYPNPDNNPDNPLVDGFFSADPDVQPSPLGEGSKISSVNTSEINLITNDFKYPQSLKVNLAIDQELPWGITGTLEGIYSKGINNVVFKNINLDKVGQSKYGRPLYGEVYEGRYGNASGTPARIDSNFTNAILLDNTNKGYNYSITGELQKQFETGLRFHISYTYNRARNVNNGTSSRAISNWQYNENFDVNNPRLGTADFETRHRILAQASYRIEYADRFATTISLIYDGRSGTPYSWVYNGNANGDTRFDNDLVYVPASEDEIVLTSNNWGEMNSFISDHPSLDDYRGEVVSRGTAREPWTNFLDLRVNQEIGTFSGQKIEVTASMFNVLNLLNDEWGKREYVSNNSYRAWTVRQYVDQDYIDANSGLSADDLNKPVISFDSDNIKKNTIYQISDTGSRWQLQLGVRYSF